MSSLAKLSIQGIRSFGPDDEDRQILKFYTPLTLIQGQNGCGKTTIIECLKYISTGMLPAGGKLSATFIHDPKIANETTVKGQVRLQFNNITGARCTAVRTMQATQMAKSVGTKTLDGMISMYRPDGTREDITSRCTDMDREMVSLLGVGKPILEHVIFCHQEDSCWPLGEGKDLKKKFDDIFASTRYVKALEMVLKERKQKNIDISQFRTEMKYLKQNKDKAAEIQSELGEVTTKYAASREMTEEVARKLEPIEAKLHKLMKESAQISKLNTEVEKLKGERDEMERGMRELQDNIENEFAGSTEDLEQQLEDFESKVRECEEKLKQHERDSQKLDDELNRISDKKSDLLLQMGKLEQEAKAHGENMEKRQEKMRRVSEHYGVSGFNGHITDGKVEEFEQKMEEQKRAILQKGRDQRAEYDEKEKKIQQKIDQIREHMTKLRTEINLKEKDLDKNKSDISTITKKLNRMEGSSTRLAELKRELSQMRQDREEMEKSVNVDDLKKMIAELSKKKSTLEASFKRLDADLEKMHQEGKARAQLEMLDKDRISKEDKIKKLMSKNEDSLSELISDVTEGRACREMNDFLYKLDKEIEKDTKALDTLRMEKVKTKQQHTNMMETLVNKKAELRDKEEKIEAECNGRDFDEVKEQLRETLKDKNEDKGVLEGTNAMFNNYKLKLQRKNAPCPLCHRDFEEETEITELIDELETKLRNVPTKLEQVTEEIDDLDMQFHNLLRLEPDKDTIKQMRQTEIPDLEKRIQSVNKRVEEMTAKITTKENDLKAKQAKSTSGHGLLPDLNTLDRYQGELKDTNKKITAQKSKVTQGDGRTVDQVRDERNDVQEKLENARSSIDHKNKKLNDHTSRLNDIGKTINEMNDERLAIERDIQEQKENEERREELRELNEVLVMEIVDCKDKIDPLEADLKEGQRERDKVSAEKDKAMNTMKDQQSKLQERMRDIRNVQDSIDRYVKAGRDTALDDCREKQNTLEAKAATLDTKRTAVMEKMSQRREDLQSQKLQERNLQDNLSLRRKRKELDVKGERISEKEKELGGLDMRNLEREHSKLRNQQEEFVKQKHQAQGRQQALADEIRKYKKDLEGDQYKDAEDKFRAMSHRLRTTEHVCDDLEKYYKALDATIMTYHKTKINEINKIIKELWRNTYKGHDIETIEIRSDEDEGANLGKRRTFNYRVVMIKGDIPIDMRGRCSAGQKVLSSLIIRLALAETFCLNCGVLALDEPTTNLDRENIESLAYALDGIIKTRSKQKNFQLLIITHDEDFVELLGRSEFVEKFVKVRKNEFGCSRLVEANVQELGTR